MVFSSLTFLFTFLPISLLLYYLVPYRFKNFILLITGLIFYGWGEPIYIVVMILSILIDYCCGLAMDRYDKHPTARRVILIVSVVMNLTLLGIFKYSSFFIDNINWIFGSSLQNPNLPLPIGISFYTFQSMSYTIDLYRRQIPVQKSFINFGAYVSMFPQLVAGPIVRYDDVRKELETRTINMPEIHDGVAIFIRGLGKKVLLANSLGYLWTTIKAMEISELSAATAWLGILAFSLQILFDFSGYSDMAVGMGHMLGFHFPENFNQPYNAQSISDFWRRWHITLGTWFREYVYIPLGGNRGGTGKTIRNLLIVWVLTGFWHGASWNFILWGLYFGLLIILERLFLGKLLQKIPVFFRIAYTFLAVVLGWVLFEFDQLPRVWSYLGAMFGATGRGIDSLFNYYGRSYLLLFLIGSVVAFGFSKKAISRLSSRFPKSMAIATPCCSILLFLLSIAYLVDSTYNPFLYFRF